MSVTYASTRIGEVALIFRHTPKNNSGYVPATLYNAGCSRVVLLCRNAPVHQVYLVVKVRRYARNGFWFEHWTYLSYVGEMTIAARVSVYVPFQHCLDGTVENLRKSQSGWPVWAYVDYAPLRLPQCLLESNHCTMGLNQLKFLCSL